jgi:hypothetical protein
MSIVPYWRLVFGAILALIVVFAPSGLMGLVPGTPLPRPLPDAGRGLGPVRKG